MKMSTRWRIKLAVTMVIVLLLGGLAFVYYFMDMVYEPELRLEAADLPAPVLESFAGCFPGAEGVHWKFDDDLFEAKFAWKGKEEVEAYFTPEGEWTRTESLIPYESLPEKARTYLESQDGEVSDVERVESPDAGTAYEVQLDHALMEWDCLFDADGALVSRIRDGSPLEE